MEPFAISTKNGIDPLTGTITVNATKGSFNASGDILVGPDLIPQNFVPITYTGCIRVLDDGLGDNGDLVGDIEVAGCLNNDVGITIEGDTLGTITLMQTGCSPQRTWITCQ